LIESERRGGELRDTAPTRRRFAVSLAGAVALAILPARASEPPRVAEPPVKIEIRARPITAFAPRESFRVRFGALEFLGGLELSSDNQYFGGISAIHVFPDGARFLAVTDRGRWLRGRIDSVGDRPLRVEDAEMAPLLGPDGRPLGARGWYDAESLALDGGTVYVGIERANRIVRFDYGRLGLLARGHSVPVPRGMREWPRNQGVEALVFVPKGLPLAGALIAISERGLDEAGNIRGLSIGGPSPGAFSLLRKNDFDVTAATITPAGDFLVLERRFTLLGGPAMRIRKIALSDIKPGAVLDGPVLIEADRAFAIDNMEALAAHRNAAGDVVLTIIADDNFNPLQRTILLRFAIVGE
jgi:hypothetical protein